MEAEKPKQRSKTKSVTTEGAPAAGRVVDASKSTEGSRGAGGTAGPVPWTATDAVNMAAQHKEPQKTGFDRLTSLVAAGEYISQYPELTLPVEPSAPPDDQAASEASRTAGPQGLPVAAATGEALHDVTPTPEASTENGEEQTAARGENEEASGEADADLANEMGGVVEVMMDEEDAKERVKRQYDRAYVRGLFKADGIVTAMLSGVTIVLASLCLGSPEQASEVGGRTKASIAMCMSAACVSALGLVFLWLSSVALTEDDTIARWLMGVRALCGLTSGAMAFIGGLLGIGGKSGAATGNISGLAFLAGAVAAPLSVLLSAYEIYFLRSIGLFRRDATP